MSTTPPHGPALTAPARPYVLADTGADGQPSAMLVTPNGETVLDAAAACTLIADLVRVLSNLGG